MFLFRDRPVALLRALLLWPQGMLRSLVIKLAIASKLRRKWIRGAVPTNDARDAASTNDASDAALTNDASDAASTDDARNPQLYTPSQQFIEFAQAKIKTQLHTQNAADSLAFMEMTNEFFKAKHHSGAGPMHLSLDYISFGKSQMEMYDILFNTTRYLINGKYDNQVGVASALLAGAKGIGKTTSALGFMSLCPVVFPTCVPVFISFEGIEEEGSLVATTCILDLVALQLSKHSIYPDRQRDAFDMLGDRIVRGLKKAGKFVLLVCDELNVMYHNDTPTTRGNLADLAFLGNTRDGRIATLLCGSSSWMELLIRGKAPASSFALMNRPTNLNSTKFRTMRIPPNLPTDLESVYQLMPESTKEECRLALFYCGANARAVQHAFQAIDGERTFAQVSLQHERLDPREVAFYELIMARLWKENTSLMLSFFRDGDTSSGDGPCNKEIAKSMFKFKFRPLSNAACEELWKNTSEYAYSGNMRDAIRNLTDHGVICTDEFYGETPQKVFPLSIFQVVEAHLKARLVRTFAQHVKTSQNMV